MNLKELHRAEIKVSYSILACSILLGMWYFYAKNMWEFRFSQNKIIHCYIMQRYNEDKCRQCIRIRKDNL